MVLVTAYRRLDQEKGLHCTLTKEFVLNQILGKPCIYCEDTSESIGCDRVDNRLPHTPENVVPCCTTCNRTRGDRFSHAEMIEIGTTIRKIKSRRCQNASQAIDTKEEA